MPDDPTRLRFDALLWLLDPSRMSTVMSYAHDVTATETQAITLTLDVAHRWAEALWTSHDRALDRHIHN